MFAKVLLSLLATALAPLLLVTFVTYRSSQETLLAVAGDSLEASAETIARAAIMSLDDAAKELESWSKLETMQIVFTGDDQYLRMSELLLELQGRSEFIEIWCADVAGKIVASSNYDRIDTTLEESADVVNDRVGSPYMGELATFTRADGQAAQAIAMAFPIVAKFDETTVIGTLIGFFDWERTSQRSSRQSNPVAERGIRLYLADVHGRIVAGDKGDTDYAALLEAEIPRLTELADASGSRGHALSEGRIDGSRQILAAVKVRGVLTGMPLDGVAIAPEAVVLQPARQQALFTLTTCAAAAVGIFVLALILSRNISRPLIALSDTAQQIAEGDLDHSPPRVSGVEIGRLAAGLDTMRLSLKRQIDTLDSSVRERTEQLE